MTPPSDAPPRTSSPPGRPLIVVADDDRAAREHLGSILRANAYDVELVADGQEALDRVSRGAVELVLLDVAMPRVGGLEACRQIKAATSGSFLPVVFVSDRADLATRVEGLRIGAEDYIGKPYEDAELLARVHAVLRTKRLCDEALEARARLERISLQDELTGLYNFRYLQARLGEEFKRAERSHEPLACGIVDVDRLRVWNERGGRPFGDMLLRGAAELIKRSVREADIVVRYGDDEFLLLLPSTHFAGSVSVAERIWREMGTRSWGPVTARDRVTLSMGIAAFPSRDVRSKESLIRAAETALSRAKRDGMDRLCVFQQESLIFSPTLESVATSAAHARRTKPDA